MTIDELIDAATHARASLGGQADVMLEIVRVLDGGEFIDSPAQSVYAQAGYLFLSGVEDA